MPSAMNNWSALFARFSRGVEHVVGSPWAFLVAAGSIIVWFVSGPLFDWGQGWQLTVNTGTTVITFLMVFVIQGTQSRDTQALHLKLDELIRVSEGRNSVISAEDLDAASLRAIKRQLQKLAEGETPSA
jgi:low affinity Fe/Cu permease